MNCAPASRAAAADAQTITGQAGKGGKIPSSEHERISRGDFAAAKSADALAEAAERAAARSSVLEKLGVKPGAYLLATIHRAENTDDPPAGSDLHRQAFCTDCTWLYAV